MFFLNFYIGDAGNTPLVDDGTLLGRDHSRYTIGSAASWRPCNVAYPHQGLVPTAEAVRVAALPR